MGRSGDRSVITFETTDGLLLEGDLHVPDGDEGEPSVAVVLCHPHPKMGGDRHNPVVEAVFERLVAEHRAVLRFDFRGVGRSQGDKGDGTHERLDALAAIDRLTSATDAPIWLAGYSFGSAVALAVVDPRVTGWLAIAPPLSMLTTDPAAGADPRPKHLLIAGHDQFSPPTATEATTVGWTAVDTTVLPGADHFLGGHLDAVADWVAGVLGRGRSVSGETV
ncbi:MAG: alpha/beta fold hydrolase [Ilumatobacteraceae bacterium]